MGRRRRRRRRRGRGTSAVAHAVASRSTPRCASALSASAGGRRAADRFGATAWPPSPSSVGAAPPCSPGAAPPRLAGAAPARAAMQARSVAHAGTVAVGASQPGGPSRGERPLKSSAIPQSKPMAPRPISEQRHEEAGRGRWRSRGWSGGATALAIRPDRSENIGTPLLVGTLLAPAARFGGAAEARAVGAGGEGKQRKGE